MKVGTRITAATSALVAVTLGVYALAELRSAAAHRKSAVIDQARQLAGTIRAGIEAQGVEQTLERASHLSTAMSRGGAAWTVSILPASVTTESSYEAQGSKTYRRIKRVRGLIDARALQLTTYDDDTLIYTLPLRTPDPMVEEGYQIAGAVEVERSISHLSTAATDDLLRTLPLLAVIVGLVIFAVMLATRTLVTRPIEKLLNGMDEVAQGDLTHVLLSEREDEIGALASRFNEMTYSLRESRAETERHNAAKMKLEKRLFQTEKMATIGQLAAEIAHEVGTPLNVIAGRARGLARKADSAETVEKNANIIAEQAGRITRIIQRLLDFTRRKVGTVDGVSVQLNTVTLSTMDFLEGKFSTAGIKHTLRRAEGLASIKGNADEIQQVLLNLLLNAIEAMPDGGSIVVETSELTRRRPGLELAPEQRWVVLSITDTGIGIPEDKLDKIFEPFYTSKQREGGTGLGLAVTHGIVKQHDGFIEVDRIDDGGTGFRIFLPVETESG